MMLLVFKLDNWHCALPLSIVVKVYRAVAVTPLPETPDIVLGIITVRGTVLPVVNIRKRFHLQEKKLIPSDQLIIAHTHRRQIALVVDSIVDVIECAEAEITLSDTILPGLDYVEGVVKTSSGMILVHDLDRFLSLEEEIHLDHALTQD
jgi:purine-binding chemotaxis protein CheW